MDRRKDLDYHQEQELLYAIHVTISTELEVQRDHKIGTVGFSHGLVVSDWTINN